MSKFKVGDRVVSVSTTIRRSIVIELSIGDGFLRVEDSYGRYYFEREKFLVLEEVYDSPLFKALKEDA